MSHTKEHTPEEDVIRINMAKSKIEDKKELAERTGLDYQRLIRRLKNPGMMRMFEFRVIIKETDMPDNDILEIVKGGKE